MKTSLAALAVSGLALMAAGAPSVRGNSRQQVGHWGTASVLMGANGEYELLWNVVDRNAIAYGNYSDMAAHPTS